MTRWWISWASTPRITARPCSSATAAWCAIEASSARSSSENGVSRSQTSSPICRPFQRSGVRTACWPARPSGHATLPSSRTSAAPGRAERLHGRLDDRLERLLEVERVRHGLGDPRQRLELDHAPLGRLVEPGVLDRLADLRGDGEQEVDLGGRELARAARAHVERPLELLAREDRDGEDRLVLVLGQVRERAEARVEVRLRGQHHRRALLGRDAGDPLARPQLRDAGHLVHAGAVRRAEDELARAIVVEVDEAGVGPERVGDLGGDEPEHLLEVERRVDRLDRLGEEPEVPLARVHAAIVGSRVRRRPALGGRKRRRASRR